MKTSDITQTVIIFSVFLILHLFNILSAGLQNIKDNWPTYRCNPMIMPFASVFGYSSGENFTYCVQNMQSDYMSYLLQPVNFDMEILGSMGGQLGTSVNSARGFISYFRTQLADIVGSIYGVFLNIMIHFQQLMINMQDMIGKLSGAMTTLVYILKGSLMTMDSTWAGPPGQVVRAVCFHPETTIQLKNKNYVKMQDIELGATLKNGATVYSVMKISNLDKNGNYIENLYSMRDGENEEEILVSGSHLVFDPILKTYVHVRDLLGRAEKTNENCKEFSCLITSNHTIPIGKWLFHDWEDNNGSPSKDIA